MLQSAPEAGYEVGGQAEAPTIVFIHGSTVTREMWRPQLEALGGAFRTVAPDLPGHGVLAGRPFTLADAVSTLEGVIEREVRDPALLVGISLGGFVGLAYARKRPEKVAGLVLAGASGNFTGWLGAYARVVGFITARLIPERRQRASLERSLRRKYAPEVAESLIGAGLHPRGAGESLMQLAGIDFRAMLAGVRAPVLILNGEDDTSFRKGEAAFAAAAPDARLEIIGGAGHFSSQQQPEAFTAAVRRFAEQVFHVGDATLASLAARLHA
jgi:pimeloyl-ACP methyl ester carboxylesterase